MSAAVLMGEAYMTGLRAGLAGCTHRQAEPVILSTGEVVACVCIDCFGSLPADRIDDQHERAEREAFCEHPDTVELTTFGSAKRSYTCIDCGAWP